MIQRACGEQEPARRARREPGERRETAPDRPAIEPLGEGSGARRSSTAWAAGGPRAARRGRRPRAGRRCAGPPARLALRHQHRVARAHDDQVGDPEDGDRPLFGEGDVARRVHHHRAAARDVAGRIGGQHLGQRLPRAEVAPAAVERQRRHRLELLHHGVVDRDRRQARVELGGPLGRARELGESRPELRRVPLEAGEQDAPAEDEDAGVPEMLARRRRSARRWRGRASR